MATGIYLNGGGGGATALERWLAPPADGQPLPEGQYVRPAARPTCRELTAANILTMDPLGIIQLYYSLQSWNSPKGECGVYSPHPEYCPANWTYLNHPPGRPGTNPLDPELLALFEGQMRDRIYQLRTDLRYLRSADGSMIPGLVDMSKVRTRPPCSLSTWGEIGKWIIAVAGAFTPVMWPVLIVELASAATQFGSSLRAIARQKALLRTILAGAYAIAAERNLELLVRAGQLTDRLTYDEAAQVPVTKRAWELAVILGLPHPAMICKRPGQPPFYTTLCDSVSTERDLVTALKEMHRQYRLELQTRMEKEVAQHPVWFHTTTNTLPDISWEWWPGDSWRSLSGIFPVWKEENGQVFLRTVETTTEPARWIPLEQIAGLEAVKEWLAWRRNPNLLLSDFEPRVKEHIANIAANRWETAQVSTDPPAGLFAGRFDQPPSSPAEWLIDKGTSSATGNLPAKASPPVPVGPWGLAPGSSTLPAQAGGVQQASMLGGGGGALLLVAGVAAWFILNRK